MIPEKIQRLFVLIDYLDTNKEVYKSYIPLCEKIVQLSNLKNALNPSQNYQDKIQYNTIQRQIEEAFSPITEFIYNPITDKLRELEIWSGDNTCASIWNNNISEIYEFRENFSEDDVPCIIDYKQKYLNFRVQTNTYFLSLELFITSLDGILKELFDFFSIHSTSEFERFEPEKVNSLHELFAIENRGKNMVFSLPYKTFEQSLKIPQEKYSNFINIEEFIMGDSNKIGDISNNQGPVSVGKYIETKVNAKKDEIKENSFSWKKWLDIAGVIFTILGTIVAVITFLMQ